MKINKDYLVTDIRKHGGKRKKPITVLIPHHNAGVTTGENLAKYIKDTSRQLSCTYVIGQEGEVFNTLDESLEPYTTGNRAIDTKAVTFEIANSKGAPNWEVTDEAFNALVNTSIDVFKRHGIKEAVYTGDKTGNIHLHEWYQTTNCPGPYLKSKMPEYARRVNEGLGKTQDKPSTTPPTLKPITVIAKEVMAGLWGNGNDRVSRLTKAGYNYASIQSEVNRLLAVGSAAPAPKPKPKPETKYIRPKGTYQEKGRFTNTSGSNIYMRQFVPNVNAVENGKLANGDYVDYQDVYVGNGYVWVGNGTTWIPTRGLDKNGKPKPIKEAWGTYTATPKTPNKPKPKPKKEYIQLLKTADSWAVYPLGKALVRKNAIGTLNPKKFGGLEYEILDKVTNGVTIQTRDYGKVNIYIGNDVKKYYEIRKR